MHDHRTPARGLDAARDGTFLPMSKDNRRRPVLEALEPRILYSADLAPIAADLSVAAPFVAPTLAISAVASTIESTQSSPSGSTAAGPLPIELAVVDTAVDGADALIADIEAQQQAGRSILIVRVDAGEDGISAVSNALSELHASQQAGAPTVLVSAIHLIGHGDTNGTVLGDTRLDIAALRLRASDFASWATALTADADILLYGCDIASAGSGRVLAQGLAELTGADVAASDDLTGSSLMGGDWQLEYTTGDIEADEAISQSTQLVWNHVLATFTVTNTNDSGAGSLRQAITNANARPVQTPSTSISPAPVCIRSTWPQPCRRSPTRSFWTPAPTTALRSTATGQPSSWTATTVSPAMVWC